MIYDVTGLPLYSGYDKNGNELITMYDVRGNSLTDGGVDYSNYSFTQKWASKGISYSQGFDIYDGKVFWVSKNGNDTIPANCYVWNLSDGSQALGTPYISIYSGHGNNLSFDFPLLYATTAYMPSLCYVNTLSDAFAATLTRTLFLNDGSRNCDACIDEHDKNILWSLAHTAASDNRTAPFYISKWDLTQLSDNGDGTYTPRKIQTVETPQPSSSFYFQGLRFHDGLLWYANGNGTGRSYVRAVNPNTGTEIHVIDLETNTEPEGVVWVQDEQSAGGYALYVGFQGMMLRKYTFAAQNNAT